MTVASETGRRRSRDRNDSVQRQYRLQISVGQALLALTLLSVALAAWRGAGNADWFSIEYLVLSLICCVAAGAFLGTFLRESWLGAFVGYVLFTFGGWVWFAWLLV
jgi:uncharacterized membrane protein YfcA